MIDKLVLPPNTDLDNLEVGSDVMSEELFIAEQSRRKGPMTQIYEKYFVLNNLDHKKRRNMQSDQVTYLRGPEAKKTDPNDQEVSSPYERPVEE